MRLYKKYLELHLQALMAYKLSFILTTFGQFFVSFNVFLGVYFMFDRFSTVKGYNFEETLLCFSIILLSFSLAECFFRGFDSFPTMIGNGEFDRILVRPRNIILQVLGSKIEFSRFGRMIQAVVMFAYGIIASDVEWSIVKVAVVISMLIGGVFLFASIFLLYASLCFFTLEGLEFMNVLTDGAREYGKYPIGIYGKNVLKFATYVVPFAFIQYYPFLYLIDRIMDPRVIVMPLAGILFGLPCYLFWRFGLRHYQSTGS
ncbi:ABC-2 family transporter protein [Vagococcus sp. BWB3-3]|uniref:ABC-2 family transporter protein n=1 Tax=Vagococcus allomyrinae TaxID=2794353 RepID=A0A940SVH7_9ENTE|nr:ABC-2 family transporter protein [Vagococcus allomyrinae]MBP1041864.1 ABC-2 family transporter protein [Vagococcus allomyrinae]